MTDTPGATPVAPRPAAASPTDAPRPPDPSSLDAVLEPTGLGPFATATAVEPAGTVELGSGRLFRGAIAEGWDIATNANGGYLLALAARALAAATERPDPITVTGHYVSPGKPGPVAIPTEVIKQGHRFATARATLRSGDKAVLVVLGTFGDLAQAHGPELVDHEPPELPDPDDCVPLRATDTFPPPFMARVELRLHPTDAAFSRGEQSGRPLMRGWFRLRHDEPVDTLALLCAVDAFPPTAFNAHLPVAWTPTIELTAHVRARPAPGWLRCQFSTHFVTGGFLEEDGEIWDATGRLVAQSRQLALVPQG
jgi:acyl-CoA thioesterase